MESPVNYFKFVTWPVPEPINTIENPVEFLREKYKNRFNFGMENILKTGIFKLGGYAYDLRPWLSIYIVKQYGNWTQYYAPNKTTLRKIIYGRIEAIQEYKPLKK